MKAVIYEKYGPPEVLQLKELDNPVPKDNEVLIRNYATSVASGDVRLRGFDVPWTLWLPYRLFMGLTRPKNKVLGFDVAGIVEETGSRVTKFKVGDRVFGSSGFKMGGYAEYNCLKDTAVLTFIPEDWSFKEAAALFFGGHTALHYMRKGKVNDGKKVLVYGASGSLGTYAVQLANILGAEVTGVCSTAKVDLVRSLGAKHVIDYTKYEFREIKEKYDVIFDTVGKSPFSWCVKSLVRKGYYLRAVHLSFSPIMKGIWTGITTSKKVIGGVAGEKLEDLEYLRDLVLDGKLKPVIDRTYPFEKLAEAHRYVETGRKKGNVVINIQEPNN